MEENKNYEVETEETAEEVIESVETAEETVAEETCDCCEPHCDCGCEAPVKAKSGSKLGIAIAAVAAAVVIIAAAIITQTVDTNKYNKLGYVDTTGRTIQEIADLQGMTLPDFLTEYGLPADMPGDTNETAAQYCIPVGTMAEKNGMTFDQLKEMLKFSDEITAESTWGDAQGSLKLADYVGEENLEEFKKEYELGDDVTGETQWKDVRNVVDEATRKAREEYEKQAEEAEKQQSTSDDTADSADNGTAGETEE